VEGTIEARAPVDPLVLEPIAARAWLAAESAELGGWLLHASAGFSGRINACWPLGEAGASPREAIEAVEAWYAARRLPPTFKLVEGLARHADLSERLRARGYRSRTETLTMTGPLAGDGGGTVAIEDAPGEAFRAVFADAAFGIAADARERWEALGRMPWPRAFACIEVGAAPAAIGTCAVEGDWAGVFAMRTAPAFRRRGLGASIFAALATFARRAGANRGYLQVEADNVPATRLYRSAGFDEAYRYRYWTKA
jgi:GNAT superfamily N-acetyltransferase